MLVTANGYSAITARLDLPRIGAWTADLSLDAPDDGELQGEIAITAGALSLFGYRYRGGEAHGRVNLLVAGGAGGLGTILPPRAYRGASVGIVLSDIATDSGETVSSTVDAAVLGTVFPKWTRARGNTIAALTALSDAAGVTWRTLPDGSIWLGSDAWPETSVDYLLLRDGSRDRTLELDVPGLDLLPGTSIAGRHVSRVVTIVDGPVRTHAFLD